MTDSDDWQPIERSNARPDVQALANGGVVLHIELTRSPDADWLRLFDSPNGIPLTVGAPAPKITSSVVTLMTREDQLDQAVSELHSRIAAANRDYEQTVLPPRREQQRQKRQAEDEIKARQAALEERVRKLLPGERPIGQSRDW